jgi:glycosyltransferase involved in cell wall biosynthesis
MAAEARSGEAAMQRRPLTVIVPTYNEEANLRACLESVRFADEILVVDSFSTDATTTIARELGARVLQRAFDTFAGQKNWTIPQASHEWILLVDADERVTPGLRDEILALLREGPRHDGYWIRRENYFLGRRMRRCGWGDDRIIRLVRRELARFPDCEVHEALDLPGSVPTLDHPLLHYSFRSFAQYWRKMRLYSEWGASQSYKKGKRAGALEILGHPIGRFVKMYFVKLGCLEGLHGLVLSMLGAFSVYLKYARLWEIDIQERAGERPTRRL